MEETKTQGLSLIGALAKALPELESAKKNKANPAFKSKYADLAAMIHALEPLIAHGLWYRQQTYENADGVTIETFYIHESGEQLSAGTIFMPATKKDAQGFGSALTYARRYALQTAFGLAVEDDDGNAASKSRPPVQERDSITDADLTLAVTLCDAIGGNQAQTICEAYRVSALTELTAKQGAAVVTRLNEKLQAKKEPENA